MWVLRSPGAPFAVGPGGSWVGSEGFGRGRLWGGAEPAVVGAVPAPRVRHFGCRVECDQVNKTCGRLHADAEGSKSGSGA